MRDVRYICTLGLAFYITLGVGGSDGAGISEQEKHSEVAIADALQKETSLVVAEIPSQTEKGSYTADKARNILEQLAKSGEYKAVRSKRILVLRPSAYTALGQDRKYFEAMRGFATLLERLSPEAKESLRSGELLDLSAMGNKDRSQLDALVRAPEVLLQKHAVAWGVVFDPYFEVDGKRVFFRARRVIPGFMDLLPGTRLGTYRARRKKAAEETRRGLLPAELLAIIALMLTGGDALAVKGESKTADLKIDKSRVFSVFGLTELVREKTGVAFFVDRRERGRHIYVSKGAYSVIGLIEAIETATGLPLRTIGETYFLSRRSLTFEGLHKPVLPKRLLDRLGTHLRFVGEAADLLKEGGPWPGSDFIAGKSVAAKALTKRQRSFVVESLGSERQNLERGIRLGTSYLLFYRVFDAPTTGHYLEIIQIYYDYRERLGVRLPPE